MTAAALDTADTPHVTKIRFFTTPVRRKPQAGDRRVTKKYGLQIRVHARAKDGNGKPFGLLVRGGRPVFDWVEPRYLASWDRHYLTPEEMQKYFPPEREPGYMQGRGAA